MNKVVALPGLKARLPEWKVKAARLVSGVVGTGPFDAVPALSEAFPLSVFPDMIGLRTEGREHLLPYAMTNFNAFGPRNALLEESLASAVEAAAWVAESCKRENLSQAGTSTQQHALCSRVAASRTELSQGTSNTRTRSQSLKPAACQGAVMGTMGPA